jgi:hypothetical protein
MTTQETATLEHRIRAEYTESPGLKLTRRQAQRLWGMDRETCDYVLTTMVQSRFLRRRDDDTFVRLESDR